MGISFALTDLDEVYRTLPYHVEIINDIPTAYLADKELFQKKVAARFDNDDYISNTPRCVCGALKERRLIGQICEECQSPVEDQLLASIESKLWMRAPNKVEAFFNPKFWSILTGFFSVKSFDVIQYLINRHYRPTGKKPQALIDTLDDLFPNMTYNRFVRDFDEIYPVLLSLKEFRLKPKREKAVWLTRFIEEYRHCIFPKYLALPSRSLSILESSHSRIYYDATVPLHLDVANTMVGIDTDENDYSTAMQENRTVKMLTRYAEFHEKWISAHVMVKESLPRRQLAGIRFDWSGRAVITSLTNVHHPKDVIIPWGMATGMMRHHIVAKLRQKGWSANECARHIDAHARKYCPILDEIFKELIAEAPGRGIPILLGRKPCLEKGNLQLLDIVAVNTDPYCFAMQISVLIIRALNADFDGDACDVAMVLDIFMHELLKPLEPHRGVHDMNHPRELSHVQQFPKETIGNLANYMERVEEVSIEEQLETMGDWAMA